MLSCVGLVTASPAVVDSKHSVTYNGIYRNGIEVFLNIRYGQDTSGANRFNPPRPFTPKKGSVIHADSYGHSCAQDLDGVDPSIGISEDCLNLNIARPNGTTSHSQLPVMVYIFGGGFFVGSSSDAKTQPDTLVAESVKNGLPVIHVAMNYRLGGKCLRDGNTKATVSCLGDANPAQYLDSLNPRLSRPRAQRMQRYATIDWRSSGLGIILQHSEEIPIKSPSLVNLLEVRSQP